MHLSSRIDAKEATKKVLEYQPPKIERGIPDAAIQVFEKNKTQASTGFVMSETVRVKTGIDKLEQRNFEEEVERRIHERIQSIQENAYQEAYQLGLEEGKQEAMKRTIEGIESKLAALGKIIEGLAVLKTDLMNQNEKHIIELCFHMAHRLAAYEISVSPEATIEIARQAVSMAQSEDQLVLQVNPEILEFFEKIKNETKREYDFLKKVKFDANPDLKEGGCIVTSNYGEVDSRIEERVKKLWENLQETLPKTKQKMSLVS